MDIDIDSRYGKWFDPPVEWGKRSNNVVIFTFISVFADRYNVNNKCHIIRLMFIVCKYTFELLGENAVILKWSKY